MSLATLERGFNLVWGYLVILKKRKEIDSSEFRKLRWSFDELIKMCKRESYDLSAEKLKSLELNIVIQKDITQKDINNFKRIRAETV